MQIDLTGRTALVTGGSRGIGRAIALRLGGAGAHEVLAGRTRSAMQKAAKRISEEGGTASVATLDVRDVQQVRDLIDGAVKQTGRLDIMVNNAGLSYPGSIADGDPQHWREMLETNVLALLVGSLAVAPAAAIAANAFAALCRPGTRSETWADSPVRRAVT